MVVDIEVRVEDRLALGADEGRLRLNPEARLLLARIRQQTRFQILRDLRKLRGDVRRFARVVGEIEELGLARQKRDLQQFPVALANGAAKHLNIDQDVVVG